jgi:hypothetical protein
MRFRKLLAIFVLAATAAGSLAAQNPAMVRKVIEIKYADLDLINKVINTFVGMPHGYTFDRGSRTVIINVPEEIAKVVEDTIRRLDVPSAAPKDIELTAWFLVASDKEPSTGTAPPAELEKVIAQLRAAFAFKNYRLIDAMALRCRSGQGAEASGAITGGQAPTLTQFKLRAATVAAGEKGTVVRIDALRAGLRLPAYSGSGGAFQYVDTGINGTDITVGEGQKVVVGKSSMEGPDKALIVVLSVKVL